MMILGWILIILGILFVLLGLANAAKTTLMVPTESPSAQGFSAAIKAITALINALAAAPPWLALTLLGFVLIYFGTRLASGLSFF